MNEINWKHEAQKQAAAAGELKIAIRARIDEIEKQQADNRTHLLFAETKIDELILEWKIGQEQKQIEWLKSLLHIEKTVLDRKVDSASQMNLERLKLPLIAIYQNPDDYPGYYIARLFDIDRPTNVVMMKKELAELQKDIREHTGLVWIKRSPNDVPALVGTWI